MALPPPPPRTVEGVYPSPTGSPSLPLRTPPLLNMHGTKAVAMLLLVLRVGIVAVGTVLKRQTRERFT
jgi:hypothetical protein